MKTLLQITYEKKKKKKETYTRSHSQLAYGGSGIWS